MPYWAAARKALCVSKDTISAHSKTSGVQVHQRGALIVDLSIASAPCKRQKSEGVMLTEDYNIGGLFK